jgi:nitrite reductase/ring-hydroxylating ferredoxin subunit
VLVAVVGVVLAFAWPQADSGSEWTSLGGAVEFAPGSVTSFPAQDLHLVRLADGEFLALARADPGDGCLVPWRSQFSFMGETGWFRNPCGGATYDMSGACVSGPCARGLDRYKVRIAGGGVQVDTTEVIEGPAQESSGGNE